MILEFRNKKNATELRHRRDFDLALIRSAAEYLQAVSNEHVRAVIVIVDGMFLQETKRIAQLAASARLPAVYGFREHVDAGGLISYGVNLADNVRRAATYVVKILKGATPGDPAVEFPNKLELIINLNTLKALGGRPFADTARADRRGDRIEMPFAAAHESVVGTFRTSQADAAMSAVEGIVLQKSFCVTEDNFS